ncbi:MAG TPA: hypothetical protein VFH23_18420 [Jiangellaceae bacterium]|nr:hypothetical protein [Jiangellaceae bacterium]
MVGVGRFETLSLADGRRKQANVQAVLTRFPGSGVGRHRSHDQNICPGTPKTLRSTTGNASADATEQHQTAPARDPLSHISPLWVQPKGPLLPGREIS